MSEFDPYLKWLGIRETTRPVNHYRLLGLELFESDKDVISMAADRQMTHIRTYQGGPNGKASQRILNELARARRCLLVEEKKLAYDAALRAQLDGAGTATVVPTIVDSPEIGAAQADPPIIQPTVVEADAIGSNPSSSFSSGPQLEVRSDPNAREKTRSREKKQLLLSLVGWVSGGLAALGVGAFLLATGILTPGGPDDDGDDDKGGNTELIASNTDEKSNDSDSDNNASNNSNSNHLATKSETDTGTNGSLTNNSSNNKTDNHKSDTDPSFSSNPTPTFEVPVVWTLDNASEYPKPNSAERALFVRVARRVSQKRIGKLESSAPSTAGTNGIKQTFSGLEKTGGIMIGVSYLLDSDHKLKNLQPVFRTRNSLGSALVNGAESLIAKPGYAVGEIQASVLSPINCVRIRFMKIESNGLDPKDSYFSSWIGREVGPVRTIANPLNAPIIGTYADFNSSNVIQTLGLIASHESMPPTKLENGAIKKPTTEKKIAIIGNSLPVISRKPVASNFFTSGAAKESIYFHNKLDEHVTLYKIDEKSNLQNYYRLGPGSSYRASSLLGTNWHVKKGSVAVATFRTEPGKNTAIIDGRDPDGGQLPKVANLEKHPIPSSSDRNVAMKEVKKIYGDMFTNDTIRPNVNRRNAESIIDQARDSDEDLAIQFAMFDAAKDMAVGKGDCRTAMIALRELDRRFDDYDFWKETLDAIEKSGKNLGRSGDKFMAQELESVVRILIDEAIMSGESRSAGKLVSFGMKAASRNGDAQALQFYKAKDRESDEVAKLEKQYQSALVKLTADPDNSNANIQKGRYLIVAKGDFNAAIECWSLSNDEDLLAIVKDESSTSANASFLARRWRNLGKDAKTAFGRRCHERAITVLQSAGKSREAREIQEILDQ